MKTAPQASADLAHVAQLIEDIPVAMLTTVEGDGALVGRPMATLEMDAQGASPACGRRSPSHGFLTDLIRPTWPC